MSNWKIREAITAGDTDEFDSLLSEVGRLPDPAMYILAIEYGSVAMAKHLVRIGTPVDMNVIETAAERSCVEILDILTTNPNQVKGSSACFVAASHNRVKNVEVLLKNGHVLDTTVLAVASVNGHEEMVGVLIRAGCPGDHTAFDCAASTTIRRMLYDYGCRPSEAFFNSAAAAGDVKAFEEYETPECRIDRVGVCIIAAEHDHKELLAHISVLWTADTRGKWDRYLCEECVVKDSKIGIEFARSELLSPWGRTVLVAYNTGQNHFAKWAIDNGAYMHPDMSL